MMGNHMVDNYCRTGCCIVPCILGTTNSFTSCWRPWLNEMIVMCHRKREGGRASGRSVARRAGFCLSGTAACTGIFIPTLVNLELWYAFNAFLGPQNTTLSVEMAQENKSVFPQREEAMFCQWDLQYSFWGLATKNVCLSLVTVIVLGKTWHMHVTA